MDLFHLFMQPLVILVCVLTRSNPQPWYIGTMLKPTELPSQGSESFFFFLMSAFNKRLKPSCELW